MSFNRRIRDPLKVNKPARACTQETLLVRSFGVRPERKQNVTINHELEAAGDSAVSIESGRFYRIRLHLRCLLRDHKYRWHLAGVWRELRSQ